MWMLSEKRLVKTAAAASHEVLAAPACAPKFASKFGVNVGIMSKPASPSISFASDYRRPRRIWRLGWLWENNPGGDALYRLRLRQNDPGDDALFRLRLWQNDPGDSVLFRLRLLQNDPGAGDAHDVISRSAVDTAQTSFEISSFETKSVPNRVRMEVSGPVIVTAFVWTNGFIGRFAISRPQPKRAG